MYNLDPTDIRGAGGGFISIDGGSASLPASCDCGQCEYCQQKAKTT